MESLRTWSHNTLQVCEEAYRCKYEPRSGVLYKRCVVQAVLRPPPTFWEGLPGPRRRTDPSNDRFPILNKLNNFIATQSAAMQLNPGLVCTGVSCTLGPGYTQVPGYTRSESLGLVSSRFCSLAANAARFRCCSPELSSRATPIRASTTVCNIP